MEFTAESIVIHDNVTSGRFKSSSTRVRGGLASPANSLAWDETVPKSDFVDQRKVSCTTAFNEKAHYVASSSD
jgi:hypothetical protein